MDKLLTLMTVIFCGLAVSDMKAEEGLLTSHEQEDHNWGYDKGHGPSVWCKTYKECCGRRQSPINLVPNISTFIEYRKLNFLNYNYGQKFVVTDNGHTVVATIIGDRRVPAVYGGGLQNKFKLHSFHFHWGHNDAVGSEHTINRRSFPLEAHFVHYNSKYETLENAKLHSDGFAVFAVLYKVGEVNKTGIAPIVDALGHVEFAGQSFNVSKPIVLRKLFPANLKSFYRYQGSLTTPPCSEIVTWTIFDELQTISANEVDKFRHTVHGVETSEDTVDDTAVHDNYRNAQESANRKVYHNIAHVPNIQI